MSGRAVAALRGGPLADRGFRLLAGGQFASTIGDYCYAIALPWLVLSTHGGAPLLGVVLACYGVPRTVLIPLGGVLADKVGQRRLMLAADMVRCVLVAALAVLAARKVTEVALLGPTAALIGAGEGLFLPASFSIIPSLLEPEQLAAGNAVSGAMTQAGGLLGPVLAGVLVALGGSTPAFAADAASFAVSALTLAFIGRGRATAAQAAEAASPDEPEAPALTVRQVLRASRFLQVALVVSVAANLASGASTEVALPALAHDQFGAGGYGALLACFGAGAMLGTLAAGRAGRLARPAVAGFTAYLIMSVFTAMLPYLGGVGGSAAAAFGWGVTNGFGNIVFITLLQQAAPRALLGRVMSLIMLASMGSFPLSVAVGGVAVRALGPAPIFPIAAGLVTVPVLAALSMRQMRMTGARTDRDPDQDPDQPALI